MGILTVKEMSPDFDILIAPLIEQLDAANFTSWTSFGELITLGQASDFDVSPESDIVARLTWCCEWFEFVEAFIDS